METVEEHERRCRGLEEARARQRAEKTAASSGFPGIGGSVWPTPDDAGTGVVPVEVAPGRGDMSYSSGAIPSFPTALYLVGMRAVSFARLFMSQPWIAACVMRMLTWGVRVPMKCYRQSSDDPADRTRLRPGDHALVNALEGSDRMSQAQLVMAMLGPMLVHGNSVTEVQSGAGESIAFTSKDWRFCRPIMPFRDTIAGFAFDTDSAEYEHDVSVDEVLHIAWWSPTGPIGCSPLQQLGVTVQIEDSAQRVQRALFANGTRQGSMITMSPEYLSQKPEERAAAEKQLRVDVTNLYAGPENSGRPILLPPGLEWKPGGQQTMVEADLIEQRRIAREEVAAVYQIPPPLIGILDKATYSNIQTQRDMSYTDCLGPPLVLIEQAFNAQVVRNLMGESDVFVEFDFAAVLRGDPLEEITAIRDAISTAALTPNEGRTILNRPKSPDPAMDAFYLPYNNLQPVGHPAPPGAAPGPAIPNPSIPPRGHRLHVRSRDRDYEREVDLVA